MMSQITNATTVSHGRRAEIGRQRRARTRARILAAAFELFGSEQGLYSRIEDIARDAGVTRATFYNHFSGMTELREALSYELTHDFLSAVSRTLYQLDDPRERAAGAIRFYVGRAREDRRWNQSMVNLSANGIFFGAETFEQAERTVVEGMEAGCFSLRNSAIGRDIVLGTCLSAMACLLRQTVPEDYPELIAGHILLAMGVPFDEARTIANRPMPELLPATKLDEM